MIDVIERIKNKIEKERTYDETAWETSANKGNKEHQVVHSSRNSVYNIILKAIDEELAKEPQECKNLSPLNEVDEFQCGECGIIIQDWTRKIVDEEDTYYSEYAFKYCPNCGRKIVVSE